MKSRLADDLIRKIENLKKEAMTQANKGVLDRDTILNSILDKIDQLGNLKQPELQADAFKFYREVQEIKYTGAEIDKKARQRYTLANQRLKP